MITKFLFLISESFRIILRAKISAVISSITIGIVLIIFSLAYLSYDNLLGFSNQFKSKYRIEVFFHEDYDLNQSRDLFNTILILEGIEQGEFIDKEKASELFYSFFNEEIEKIIGDNPLPMGGRFEISADYRDAGKMKKIVEEIRMMHGVDLASFQQGIISRIDSVMGNLFGIFILLGISIFIVSITLVSNTMRLIIHAKQDSIETLHLLGATNSFIRFPLVVEGIIQGLLGAAFSLLFLYVISSFQEYLFELFIPLPLINPLDLLFHNILLGIILALIGSYRGISKYLPK